MYTLMDIEWVQNEDRKRHPTQIAAIRTDENWTFQNAFFTRVKPLDESFQLWNHKAYTGGSAEDFLSAPTLAAVSDLLQAWFQDDDILCWWTTDPMDLFNSAFTGLAPKQLVLFPYLQHFLADRPYLAGSAFHIADQLKIERYGSRHDSRADAEMMRRALWTIRFPRDLLTEEPPPISGKEKTFVPYVLDVATNRVHKRECDMLPESGIRKEYPNLQNIVTNSCKACSCCAQDFATARRERNRRIVTNNPCNYIFTANSDIFHTRDCKLVLSSTGNIRGTNTYKRCIEKRKRPCKVCKPLPSELERLNKINPSSGASMPESAFKKQNKHPKKRNLTGQEQRALKRLKQAQEERKNAPKLPAMSNQQIADLQSLTHSGYAFWAATGYKRFHLRHCSRLNSVSNIKGFALYEDAIQMGYRPCRQCKPTPKHNMELSFPFFSKERPGEHVGSIKTLCNIIGYQCTELDGGLQIETPKGIWRVYTDSMPYRLEHINKRSTPGNTTEFHVQPRIFLSLTDVYMYIKRHDSEE